jgi:hypothetical protein
VSFELIRQVAGIVLLVTVTLMAFDLDPGGARAPPK